MPPKKSFWQTNFEKIEKIIGIILFIITLISWIVTHTIEKTQHDDEIKQIKIDMVDIKTQLKSNNDYITQQALLNGKILEYIDLKEKK